MEARRPSCFGTYPYMDYQLYADLNCCECAHRVGCSEEARGLVPDTRPEPETGTALEQQIAGDHYKSLKIQPVEFIHANNIGFLEGNAIKYLCRWRNKNGVEDLEKAKHYIEMLIEMEQKGK